jgi:hypothetical protein
MQQIDAVIKAIMKVKPDFQQYKDKGIDIIVDDLRKQVCEIIKNGILNGSISYDKDITDIKAITKYVPSMVSNWLRRSRALNGNSSAIIQNPGSRIGVGDEQLKVLRELYKTQVEPEILTEINKYISIRINQLKTDKATIKQNSINMDALPMHLRDKLKL